jgi:hypothetical protein
MAAQYTEVTLTDMDIFLKRGFRALRPKQGLQFGEYFYDLFFSSSVALRVWTSIRKTSEVGAGVGEDAIRVQLMGVDSKRPLMKGKAPIVKRTQGWKNTLQNRIEEAMEAYEEKPDYWDERGGGVGSSHETPKNEPPSTERSPAATGVGPSDKQINYLSFLVSSIRSREQWAPFASKFPNLSYPFTKDDLRKLTGRQASYLIDVLKNAGFGQSQRRYADYDRS